MADDPRQRRGDNRMLVDTDPNIPPRRRWHDDPPLRDTGELPAATPPPDPHKYSFIKDLALKFLPTISAGLISLVIVVFVTQKDVGILSEGVNVLKMAQASQMLNNISMSSRVSVVETNQQLFSEFKAKVDELNNVKTTIAAQGASMDAMRKSMDEFTLELRELRRKK